MVDIESNCIDNHFKHQYSKCTNRKTEAVRMNNISNYNSNKPNYMLPA